jgi:aspartyl-tRNA(Asn)/glutamyl-tRNA(Gln) amidotransferase subunit A
MAKVCENGAEDCTDARQSPRGINSDRNELWARTATELAAAYQAGETSPEHVLEAVLTRFDTVNPTLNAIVTLDRDGARAAARQAGIRLAAGKSLGLLDGVPVTVKDNLFVGGLRATWGSRLFKDFVADLDDAPIAALRAAGAIILGKTNTPEFAASGYTNNLLFGPTGNPWSPGLSPGGSSGGAAAAVAAGLGPLAIGTDAGGSIRRPAAHTGIAALKPGIGRVPRRGGFPQLNQDLQVIGTMARSVADLKAAFAIMASPSSRAGRPIHALRVGVIYSIGGAPIEPSVENAFVSACRVLKELGHNMESIDAPWLPTEVNELFFELTSVGTARVLAERPAWRDEVTPSIRDAAEAGAARLATDYLTTLDRLAAFREYVRDALGPYDVVATPAASAVAWPKSDPYPRKIAGYEAGPRDAAAFSTAINLAGLPAIVVPAPVKAGELPAGLQLIGRMGSEELLLDLAETFETAQPWPQLAPL